MAYQIEDFKKRFSVEKIRSRAKEILKIISEHKTKKNVTDKILDQLDTAYDLEKKAKELHAEIDELLNFLGKQADIIIS